MQPQDNNVSVSPNKQTPVTDEHVILTLDTPNANGRTYTTESIQQIIDKFNERQAAGAAVLGELGYPTENFSIVEISNVSHQVTNMRIENGKLLGTIKLLNTPNGIILKNLLDKGHCGGFRPRGFGDVSADGTITNYKLISIDYVNDPAWSF